MFSVEERAKRILAAVDMQPATRAASGRYLRSVPIRPGVRFWATSQPRLKQDYLGIQFHGTGRDAARRLAARLESAGFLARNPQTGQDTFAKSVPFGSTGEVDSRRLQGLRRELDAILRDAEAVDEATEARPKSFREFMLASPLAEVGLDLPPRDSEWRQGAL